MNLYQIEQELLDLYNQIEENGGEITPEIEERFQITEQNFVNKLENYTRFVRVIKGDISTIDSEIERLSKLKQIKQNVVNRLENNMLSALKIFGNKDPKKDIWRYDLITFKLSTRQSQSVEILDETIIDDKFKKISFSNLNSSQRDEILELLNTDYDNSNMTETISKTAIKEAIKNGEIVNGASIKINHSLSIK